MPVIEMLQVRCRPGRRADFVVKDAEVWTPALAAHDGYISKQVWASLDDPDLVTIIVHWESLAQWKSFPDELNLKLDAEMQDVQISVTSEAYEVVA
jgi:uncharacterized protein (TIGR03792 family)